ncbi:MAG TPA: phospholipase D-like domain-containing protein [Vicinamibacterales bacterium]|nr:phospholipase D-like domain-containing protein [Vicinamibacterales bacterium]
MRTWTTVASRILKAKALLLAGALFLAAARPAVAADQVYFSAVDDIAAQLVQRINAETVRIDMSAWYLTDSTVYSALLNRFRAGVQVRLIGDRGSIFEIDKNTKNTFYYLASQGVPIRLRYNPTWYPEIDHWKATIFVGQNLVAFGSPNYTPFELTPFSSTNYKDEVALFTTDSSLVGAFKTKFDKFWHDVDPEPESLIPSAPYFKNWDDACTAESACSDYRTLYPNPVPMVINTARLEPDNPMPPDMVWGQGSGFNNRLVSEINNETTAVDFVIYRLTVDNITEALLQKKAAGVPIRLIVEPDEYMNRKWPEFWLTHANEDKLWAAGIPMKMRAHTGLTHMKVLITSTIATIASSNYAAAWQRDHDYFLPAATKPAIHTAIRNRFQTMWNDSTGFVNFTPQGPDAPTPASPVSGSTGVSTTPTLSWSRAVFATNYDVYLGTSANALTLVGNVPAQLVNDPPTAYSFTPATPLAGNTTYYWKVVSRTNATPRDPNMVASSSIQSFTTTTGGTPPAGLPSPWLTQDVGAVGVTGNASYSNGVFTVAGAGADIWGTADAFRYVYQSVNGDSTIIARVASMQNTNSFAKAGVMLRASLAAGAAHVILDVRPDGGIEFMTRSATNGSTTYLSGASQPPPAWLKLSRSANTVTGYVSANGSTWTAVGSTTTTMSTSAYLGFLANSHTTTSLNTSTFDNVSVTTGSTPPPPAPGTPTSPAPANGATGVSVTPTLTWASTGATSYTVAFGTTSPPPQVSSGQTAASYTPAALAATTTYFWQIVATNSGGSTSGPVWSFTTGSTAPPPAPGTPTSPAPANGATGVSVTPTLTWASTGATSYAVAFGTTNPPPQVSSGQTAASYTPAALAATTTYFWQIVATNSGGSTTGPVWSFTTGSAPPPPPGLPSPWTSQDVGATGLAGNASYANGAFTVSGAGADVWGTADAFRYVSQPTSGDVQIIARVTALQNTNQWAKAGVMLRQSLTASSAHILLDVTPGGTVEFMTRASNGATTTLVAYGSQPVPAWLKLARVGSTVTASVSSNGSTWTSLGSTTTSIPTSAIVGLMVTSHDVNTLNTSTFDNVAVTTPAPPPPPPPTATNVVIYANDIATAAIHGSWSKVADATSPSSVKLSTPDAGVANANNPLASPSDYVDVTFNAEANTPYTIWLRLKATANSKYNDAVWVQFSDALANGSPVYPLNSTAGLLVNLATSASGNSLNNWGWQNAAYWLSQATTVTFANSGAHTLRIQIREDGVQFDQVVLSPTTYLSSSPGTVTNDSTIVPKP